MTSPSPFVSPTNQLHGVWLPIVTPFLDGKVDYSSYERLLEHYLAEGIDGLIPLGTTGESPTVDDAEIAEIVAVTARVVKGRVPVFVGIGGNSTAKVIRQLQQLEAHPFDGILSVCPYYSRPSQSGLYAHFRSIAESTARQVLVYNIPYRTAVNLENDTLLELAKLPNIVGVKDSSGSLAQSLDLLKRRPANFAVLTGEDAHFCTMLAKGADGGILASAHIQPRWFRQIHQLMRTGDGAAVEALWSRLEPVIALLFAEPNPMPLKHWLWRAGRIASRECRLPLDHVSDELGRKLDSWRERLK